MKSVYYFLTLIMFLSLGFSNAQTQRNPVLEYCTGTWCQYCPCGHQIIRENILPNIPNAIIIGYHGPSNSSDPFRNFTGNTIIGSLTFSSYPTGIVDRTSAPMSRSSWYGVMNQRINVPATVSISLDKDFNKTTGELSADVSVTALQNLTGDYNVTLILLEDGLVASQTGNVSAGCIGGTNYVHDHVVRAMINGATGESLNNGNPWNTNETLTKNIVSTVPSNFVYDSCHLVAIVTKVASPLYMGEIQQAEQWTLVSPDYVAAIASSSSDVLADNTTPVSFNAVLENQGLLQDTYNISLSLEGPSEWTGEFTTLNGTFPFGTDDTISLSPDDTASISILINPNGFDGYGKTLVTFSSKNDPGIQGSIVMKNITTTGVDAIVILAGENGTEGKIDSSFQRVFTGSYGLVSREALLTPTADLSHFQMVFWSAGNVKPVFIQEEINLLEDYLDGTSNLFINGQNIGSDIFGPNATSQIAQSFYNNYLHASFIADTGSSYLIKGVAGDIIGDTLIFVPNGLYPKSPDLINPYDNFASPVFKFLNNTDVSSIKAETENSRLVYLGFCLEQSDDKALHDSLILRSARWFAENPVVGVNDKSNMKEMSFALQQNYPNPFNPETIIKYSVPENSNVILKVYDIIGREIATLVNGNISAGNHQVQFNAGNLASGIYIYKITAGEFSDVKKMTILK